MLLSGSFWRSQSARHNDELFDALADWNEEYDAPESNITQDMLDTLIRLGSVLDRFGTPELDSAVSSSSKKTALPMPMTAMEPASTESRHLFGATSNSPSPSTSTQLKALGSASE